MAALDDFFKLGKPVYAKDQASRRGGTPAQRAKITLENNIAYFNDSNFRVNGPAGPRPPVKCFEKAGSKSRVWLTYLNKKVDLGEGRIAIEIPEDKIMVGLEGLIEVVESGELDETLSKMASEKKEKASSRKTRRL